MATAVFEFELFTSHAWGLDRVNHIRVVRLAEVLTSSYKLKVWIDKERLEGDVLGKITNGVDKSKYFGCFVTKDYMEKIEVTNKLDYCNVEFDCAIKRGKDQFIVIVMEPGMKKTAEWKGKLGAINQLKFIDFTDDSKLDSVAAQIADKVGAIGPGLMQFFSSLSINPNSALQICAKEGITSPDDMRFLSEEDLIGMGFKLLDVRKLKAPTKVHNQVVSFCNCFVIQRSNVSSAVR